MLRSLPVLVVYTLLGLFLTYPLVFHLTTAVPNDIGDPLLNTWILAWDSHALLANPLNLFNANIFHPLPNTLAYSEHLFSTALFAFPWQLCFGEPILAYNLSLLATFPLAGWGMYLLALHWTGHRRAAFIAGLVFAFHPYRFAAIAHLQLLTFQWLPYALLFLDKIITSERVGESASQPVGQSASQPGNSSRFSTPLPSRFPAPLRLYIGFGFFLLCQILASWYLAVYTILILGIYLLAVLLARRFRLSRPILLLAALGLVALLTLPFIVPYLSLVAELREARPLSLALSMAAAPLDFFTAASFNRIFGLLTEPFRSRPGFTEENTLFVGIVTPALALAASLAHQRSRDRCQVSRFRFYALLGVLILAVSLTFAGPYAFLANFFPPGTIVRVPPRWIIPALFALAGLAAFGYAGFESQIANRKLRFSISKSLLLICSLLMVAESLSIPLPLAPVENRTTLSPVYHRLAEQPDHFALIELPLHSAPAQEYPEVKRLYASTLGWWRLVNGYSGYTPPRQSQLAQALNNFPDDASIETLQTLVPNSELYLLVHPGEAPLDRVQWETTDRWRAERYPALYPVGEFAGDYLYQILPDTAQRFSGPPLATFGPNRSLRLLAATVDLPSTTASYAIHNSQFTIHNSSLAPRLLLYWQATAPLSADYTVFIHLRAADGFVRSQADGPPVGGHYPTTRWQPGEVIQDVHALPPEDFSQVDHLAIGLYNPITGQRLVAFGPDGVPWADQAVIVKMAR
ncbi:MAG: hypothetical protein JXM69_11335 [Anaerolineae bacterium]|nr:hypothetical protein [Anaerolineae bacterium]